MNKERVYLLFDPCEDSFINRVDGTLEAAERIAQETIQNWYDNADGELTVEIYCLASVISGVEPRKVNLEFVREEYES